MRTYLPFAFVAVVVAVFGVLVLGRDSESPGSLDRASLAYGEPNAPFDACGEGCGPPTPTPTPAAKPSPAPTPCPYCDQDEQRWRQMTTVPPPELLGKAAVLIEGECGEVVFGQSWRERRQPASLAKIATAMVVVESADLSDVVNVEITGWELSVENESSIMGLIAGMQITVEELLYGLLLASGNDAALELSRHLGGEPAVVAMMNRRAAELGLTDTKFQNSHGLDAPGAYTTPFDMALLGRELLDYALLRQVVATEFRPETWHDLGGLWNGNYLLYIYEDAIGVKTGYTEEAGWLIVSAAERNGRALIASVFDSADVYWDSMRLFDWAFENTSSACAG